MIPDVDVVVVAYRSEETVEQCVHSARRSPVVRRVIVVDNGSPDRSAAAARRAGAEVVPATNRGFGAGCNAGAAVSDAPFVLFLNPDAEVDAATPAALRRRLEARPDVGAVASDLVAPDGSFEPSCRRGPSVLRSVLEPGLAGRLDARHYRRSCRSSSTRGGHGADVAWVTGASFMVRREAFESVGGFDESYFLYAEEADLCARLVQRGWRIEWFPGAVTVHRSGHSTGRLAASGKLAWVDGWLRYTRTHHPRPQLARAALVVGLLGRAGAWRILGHPDRSTLWWTVARRAISTSMVTERKNTRLRTFSLRTLRHGKSGGRAPWQITS